MLAYLHVKRKWTALNDCGIDVLTPKVWTLGTMGQYFVKDGYVKWTKEELLDKNRKTVAFYRGVTPIIITGKGHKCTSCHYKECKDCIARDLVMFVIAFQLIPISFIRCLLHTFMHSRLGIQVVVQWVEVLFLVGQSILLRICQVGNA